MMNRKDFFEYVKDNVSDYLPEKYADANIHLQEVVKKNGLTVGRALACNNGDGFGRRCKWHDGLRECQG